MTLNDEQYEDMGVLEAAEYIKTLDNLHDFDRIFVDRTAIGQGTIETLANDPVIDRKHEPIYFSVQKKQQIYQRLKAALESEALYLPPDKTLRDELESIGSDKTRSGNIKLHPRGDSDIKRDDNVDALALATWGMPEFGDTTQSRGAKRAVSGRRRQPGADRTQHSQEHRSSSSAGSRSYTVNRRGRSSTVNDRNHRSY